MTAGGDWSREEVEAVVADYLAMLMLELSGTAFSKAQRNRELRAMIPERTAGSVEYKHQNISAVLLDLGYPYIEGYKPARNYQALLAEVVSARVIRHADLLETLVHTIETIEHASDVLTPAAPNLSLLDALTTPPRYDEQTRHTYVKGGDTPRLVTNWLELEASRQSRGAAGEQWVLRYEEERLTRAGQRQLARRIEHVSDTRGDRTGYDIHSFEVDGRERLIEVKTTLFGIYTPFFASRNEVEVSAMHHDRYHLYRLFSFVKSPRLYTLTGSLRETCRLDPVVYQATSAS